MSLWIDALKRFNKDKGAWCIPRKGTKEYDAVKAFMGHKKNETIPEAKPTSPKKMANTINTPYVYKVNDPDQWLRTGISLLKSAKKYAEKHPPKPRSPSEMKETFGLMDISLDELQALKKYTDYMYLGGEEGRYRTDVWNNDTKIEWDWEKKGNLYYPKKVIGGRIGFQWLYPSQKDKRGHIDPDEEFENIIRLSFEIDDDNKTTYKSHARTEYEKSDDSDVDELVEKELNKLTKD